MVILLFNNTDFQLACSELGLRGLGLKPLASGCVNLHVEQEVGPRARNKKEPDRFCPVGLDAELVLKETANGLRSGSLASNSEISNSYCSSRVRVSRTIENFFCANKSDDGSHPGHVLHLSRKMIVRDTWMLAAVQIPQASFGP